MIAGLPLTLSEAVIEAESITAEAASAAWVDEGRREFERRQSIHLFTYGFDYPEAVES